MPISQYSDDVKKIARDNNLVIVDARFSDIVDKSRLSAEPPKLTKKRGRKSKTLESDAALAADNTQASQ